MHTLIHHIFYFYVISYFLTHIPDPSMIPDISWLISYSCFLFYYFTTFSFLFHHFLFDPTVKHIYNNLYVSLLSSCQFPSCLLFLHLLACLTTDYGSWAHLLNLPNSHNVYCHLPGAGLFCKSRTWIAGVTGGHWHCSHCNTQRHQLFFEA